MRLCSPAHFGNASFSPPVGDGWLQLSTNNHSRSIWLNSLCLDLGNKLVSWKWSCFMRAAFVCLVAVSVVVCCSHEKRIFTQQIHVVEFLHGDFLSLRNSAVLWHVSKVIYNVCWTRCSAVSQSRWASDPSVRGSWVRQWRGPRGAGLTGWRQIPFYFLSILLGADRDFIWWMLKKRSESKFPCLHSVFPGMFINKMCFVQQVERRRVCLAFLTALQAPSVQVNMKFHETTSMLQHKQTRNQPIQNQELVSKNHMDVVWV